MICINSQNEDPYFNLAAEEYLLREKTEDIFMLWVGTPSIIVGKHQNALGEIDYYTAQKKKIEIARRLSGGGTVYHDTGNLNFTWILNGESGKLVDFKKFINPIMDFLKVYDVEAEYGGRNDIIIKGKKVSGNAEHVYKKRTLHHGTLLFETKLDLLKGSLKIDDEKYIDKAVKSVPHPVGNIKELTETKDNFDEFRKKLFNYILELNKDNRVYTITNDETLIINKLTNDKYNKWEWIFGYSPLYTFKKTVNIQGENTQIEFKVKKGCISDVILNTSNIEINILIISGLNGALHHEDSMNNEIHNQIEKYNLPDFDIQGFTHQLF